MCLFHFLNRVLVQATFLYCSLQIYLIQRNDTNYFKSAKDIDHQYFKSFQIAKKSGVEILVLHSLISKKGIELSKKRNVKNFEVAFEIAIKAFYGEGLSQKKSSKDVANAEKIMMSSFENILNLHGSDEGYNEIIRLMYPKS